MLRPGRVTLIKDDVEKERLFMYINRMYEETVDKLHVEWTKFATLRGYIAVAKANIRTMAQEDGILWTCHE